MNTLTKVMQSTIGYNPEKKKVFHSAAKKALKALAVALNLKPGEYDLRSNQGGIAVSGEVTLHSDHIYVQVSQSCLGPRHEILFRSCNGRKDYTGGPNRFADVVDLENAELFAVKVLTLIK